MTTLSAQLESLRTATALQLTVERKHVSLIFDKKEAKKLDRETIYKIGCTGLKQLKKLDPIFNKENELFEESSLNFQRSLICQEENVKLNKNIETFLFHLSPYIQHFACQQVLEWLVYKYQIHAYNAESMIVTFLPFHETNFYGRMLSIVEFNFSTSKEWNFLEGYCEKEFPVPFTALLKNTLSSTHSLLSRISNHIDKGIELVGEEFLETKAPVLFTFYAKLLLSVLEDATRIDDSLLSKVIPLVANGLKSPLPSFRHASLMVICQLSISVKLAPHVVSSLSKMLLMKLKENSLSSSLSTLIVLCQHQCVELLSTKAVLKLVRNADILGLWSCFRLLAVQTDLISFLNPLWTTLFMIIADNSQSEEVLTVCIKALRESSLPELLSSRQAAMFLSKIFEMSNIDSLSTEKKFVKHIYTIVARYADEWEKLCSEWLSRDEAVLNKIIDLYSLHNVMVIPAKEEAKKKRVRRRSNSIRRSVNEDVSEKSLVERKTAAIRAKDMAEASDFAQRKVFLGDPLKKAIEWIKEENWDNVSWALNEMARRKAYFNNKVEEDIFDFVLSMIRLVVNGTKGLVISEVRCALAEAPLKEDFIVILLTRHESIGSAPKKLKTDKNKPAFSKVLESETNEQWEKRLTFVLEVLNMSNYVIVSARLFGILFGIVKQTDVGSESNQLIYVQQLALSLLIKMLKNPGKYHVSTSDLHMDSVVETMRSTHSHHVMRESLRLLTAAVRLSPSSVTSHVMSVFTFMGSGLLRKDNELTLSIIESTLEALFHAVVAEDGKSLPMDVCLRLIEVTRVFASSACDIPAHRRARMAHAISRAIRHINVWIVAGVLLEGFCAKWQRSASDVSRKSADQDAFEDLALDLCSRMEPVYQLSVALDLVQFVVRLGGDAPITTISSSLDSAIFDRTKYSLPKLRHFRFVIIGLIVKILSNRQLYEKLATSSDDALYKIMSPIGKRLMISSVELDEFTAEECTLAEKVGDPQALRYWIALSARAETVAEKLRYLLPGAVAADLIIDVLEDEKTDWRMREKTLQLTNLKLMHDGYFYTNSGINEQHLNRMAVVLNKWIGKERSSREKITLCQSAAFSLKLVAKRIPMQSESPVLTETMNKCIETAAAYQTLDECMIGNILLLAGELIRSHNIRSTMLSAVPLLKTCIDILAECISNHANAQKVEISRQSGESVNKLQRIRQQSLCGRKLGSDTLLVCTLTCMQRILDQFASFVSEFIPDILVRFCRLTGRFCESDSINGSPIFADKTQAAQNSRANIQYRLGLIRKALLKIEIRVLPAHFASAVKQLLTEEKPICVLFSLFGSYFEISNRAVVVQIRNTILTDIYLPALEYRMKERKPENFENIATVERCIFDSLLCLADVLTEHNMRSIMGGLIDWAEHGMKSSASYLLRVRLVPVFHFANRFYNSYNSLSLPYFGKLIEMAPKVLKGCNATNITEISLLLLNGKRDTIEGLEADFLVLQVIKFIANCARHHEFLMQDRAEMLIDPLVEELVNTKLAGHESRCIPHLSDALYRLADAHPDLFSDILTKILIKTRSNKPKIRYRTLLVVEALFDKVGDGIAPQLPMVMPFLSELFEDENKNVEEQCDRVVRLLQKKFGENIAEGFT